MTSINGWSNVFDGVDNPRQILENMFLQSQDNPDNSYISEPSARCSLAVSAGLYQTSVADHEGIKLAIIGTPTWSNQQLDAIAKEQGLAVSAAIAYQQHGKDMLPMLQGPFALAVITTDSSMIAVDRIGIFSLSYALIGSSLIFSSSSLSVARHSLVNSSINSQGIFNFFYFYDIPSPGTIHTGVNKLQPAEYLQLVDGTVNKGFYWNLKYCDSASVSFQDAKDELNNLLEESISSLSRDGKTATFLSGGIDSSTITGKFAGIADTKVNSYTMGFGAEGFDEMEYARLAADHFGVDINEYYIQPEDILEAIPVISRHYDEPFGNESAVPAYFCAKKAAADGIDIMLAGDGGDEIFGGNERYSKQMVFEHYGRIPRAIRSLLLEPVASGFPAGDSLMPVRKLRSYISQAKIPLPKRLETYNFILRQPLDSIFTRELLGDIDPELPGQMLDDTYFRSDSSHPIHRMLHLDMKFTLADNDLRKVSRMCEAAGIKVRYPILDEKLVEFSGRLPAKYKVNGHRLRWFFKEAMKGFLPDQIINKSKHGFGLPFGVWAISHPELSSFVNTSLDRFQDRNYLQPDYIREIRKLHANEHPTYYGKMIWLMLIMEQWLETHCDNVSA